MMEDLLSGANDWRNIQDVVRSTFKALHDVVRAHGDKLRQLEASCAGHALAGDMEALSVSLSNKPTFVELGKALNARVEELGLNALRAQVALKADKADLQELYGDVGLASQRLGEGTAGLELLVRQQGAELEALKREVRRLQAARDDEEASQSSRLANRKWVEEALAGEAEARRQAVSALRREAAERAAQVDRRLDELPAVATLDEVFAQKVDMATLTRALQDRPSHAQVMSEVQARLSEQAASQQQQWSAAVREAAELALRSSKHESERLEEMLRERAGRGELLQLLGTKLGSHELEEKLAQATEQLAQEVRAAILGVQKELVQVLNKKAFKHEVAKALQSKASVDEVQQWIATKVELADVRDSLQLKADHAGLQGVLQRLDLLDKQLQLEPGARSRTGTGTGTGTPPQGQGQGQQQRRKKKQQRSSIDKYLEPLASEQDEQEQARREEQREQQELDPDLDLDLDEEENHKHNHNHALLLRKVRALVEDKASIKDVCVLLDQKANIKDVNEALQVSSKRNPALALENEPAFAALRRELSSVQDAVSAELAAGRWIWSSGRTLPDRAVPWNIECINTASDNLLWKQDAPDITTVMPGLYELTLGFFSETDPDLQLLVNGEPVLFNSAATTHHQQQHHQHSARPHKALAGVAPLAKRGLQRARHSAGNVTGYTAIDFVALPARARITLLFQGEMGAQGFFGLRKL
jgi:hypothetical protein